MSYGTQNNHAELIGEAQEAFAELRTTDAPANANRLVYLIGNRLDDLRGTGFKIETLDSTGELSDEDVAQVLMTRESELHAANKDNYIEAARSAYNKLMNVDGNHRLDWMVERIATNLNNAGVDLTVLDEQSGLSHEEIAGKIDSRVKEVNIGRAQAIYERMTSSAATHLNDRDICNMGENMMQALENAGAGLDCVSKSGQSSDQIKEQLAGDRPALQKVLNRDADRSTAPRTCGI